MVANYVAMTPQGKIFDSSLDRGSPYDFRGGSGQVIPGLDEGIRGMQPGGVRRLYIPGNLAFPKVCVKPLPPLAQEFVRAEASLMQAHIAFLQDRAPAWLVLDPAVIAAQEDLQLQALP